MKSTFLNIASRKAQAKNQTNRRSTPPNQVHSAGILFTSGDDTKLDEISGFARQLQKEGKSVMLLEFSLISKVKSTDDSVFSMKDISFFGTIDHPGCLNWMNQEFDYLFLADRDLHPATRLVLSACKAKCRVGVADPQLEPFLDLMMDTSGNWGAVLRELLDLTRKLS